MNVQYIQFQRLEKRSLNKLTLGIFQAEIWGLWEMRVCLSDSVFLAGQTYFLFFLALYFSESLSQNRMILTIKKKKDPELYGKEL